MAWHAFWLDLVPQIADSQVRNCKRKAFDDKEEEIPDLHKEYSINLLYLVSQYMKIKNVHTDATSESMIVSIDFFLFMDARI